MTRRRGVTPGIAASDQPLTPGAKRPPSKPSGESLDPGEPDAEHFVRLSIEDVNSGVTQDPGNLALLARLVVMVAQHGHDRHRDRPQRLSHEPSLFRVSPVGQVTAEGKHIGLLRYLAEQDLQGGVKSLSPKMDVADRGDAYRPCCFRRHCDSIHGDINSHAVTCATPPWLQEQYHRPYPREAGPPDSTLQTPDSCLLPPASLTLPPHRRPPIFPPCGSLPGPNTA